MFKIEELYFKSMNELEEYTYKFNSGINYFIGKNNIGKTEFYNFIDFMLGSSYKLNDKPCYKNIKLAKMLVKYNDVDLILERTNNPDINKIYNSQDDEDSADIINLEEYTKILNNYFTKNEESLKELRSFSEEKITYRTFTMFNFIDESSQGIMINFLTKCKDIRYSVKLDFILNFIFNNKISEIKEDEIKLLKLNNELKQLENNQMQLSFILDKVNDNLRKLSSPFLYDGKNNKEILDFINKIENQEFIEQKRTNNNLISDLEIAHNAIYEQIKNYKNEISDIQNLRKIDKKRLALLKQLNNFAKTVPDMNYLIEPTKKVIENVNQHIYFSDYLIKEKAIEKLEEELNEITLQIKNNDTRFKFYSIDEKSRAIANIKDYLNNDIAQVENDTIEKLKLDINELKKKIKELKKENDTSEINKISNYITTLYISGKDTSNFITDDISNNNFKIKYIKKGNCLQPVFTENNIEKPYHTGSMARHTLIQLCGYLAFLRKLLSDDKYPIVPILVIDHISKSFDNTNKKIINTVLSKALNDIGKDNLQIFMFDTEEPENLGIDKHCSQKLVEGTKTGFCPFYKPRS